MCDIVLVETVGVGQSETDIANIADTVVLVVQPFSGDVLQFIKAGVMEIPDILAVNKADDEALARKAMSEVKAALAIENRTDASLWATPVLAVSAASNLNVAGLDTAIAEHYQHLQTSHRLMSRRADQEIAWAVGEVIHELGRLGLATLGGRDGVAIAWQQQPETLSTARKLAALLGSAPSATPSTITIA